MTVSTSPIRWARLAVCAALFTPVALTSSVQAQSQSFKHPDGTTHWYEAVAVAGGINWTNAHLAAAQAGGYLATITSKDENDVITKLVSAVKYWSSGNGPWLGGIQPSGSVEPGGGWSWVEIESFSYSNWAASKPDNSGGADAIYFHDPAGVTAATWSDGIRSKTLPGYVIEYSGPLVPQTVGLQIRDSGSFDGYTLLNPLRTKETMLVDTRGRVVHSWPGTLQQAVVYLEPNGNLLRSVKVGNTKFTRGGNSGRIEEHNWQGTKVWQFEYSTGTYCLHHDVARLPNGNLLMIAWELIDKATALAAGRDPSKLTGNEVWPEKIIEVKPMPTGGKIVWEWRLWDHLIQDQDNTKANYGDVAKHPELVDLNFTPANGIPDWIHMNAVNYNPKLDQIVMSARAFDELWIIDHSTTTAEAASHQGGRSGKGGDLLYRWGNPIAYRAGTTNDRTLFKQHDVQWIPDNLPGGGHLLIFNNGPARRFSSVDEIVAPAVDSKGNYPRTAAAWGPSVPVWSYTAPTRANFFSGFISGVQRLPNGNTLICEGAGGRFFEVTNAKALVWQYRNPVGASGTFMQGDAPTGNPVFRCLRYPPDYSAFKNRNLTPGEPKETYGSILLADGSPVSRRAPVGTSVVLTLKSSAAATSGSKPFYQLATSATKGLIAIDTRFARIGVDPLLFASISNTNTSVFQNYFGQLDVNGRASAKIIIPAVAALAGLDLQTTFIVTDVASPSTVGLISNTVEVRIIP